MNTVSETTFTIVRFGNVLGSNGSVIPIFKPDEDIKSLYTQIENATIYPQHPYFKKRNMPINFLRPFFNKHRKQQEIDARLSQISNQLSDLTNISARLSKIESKQKESGLQLEEINELLQNGIEPFTEALIAIADNVEDFYRFAAEDERSPLYRQAASMWQNIKNELASAGISVIDDKDRLFDFERASAAGTGHLPDIPDGHVVKTLKCGYIFGGKILRRSSVIVNKYIPTEEQP